MRVSPSDYPPSSSCWSHSAVGVTKGPPPATRRLLPFGSCVSVRGGQCLLLPPVLDTEKISPLACLAFGELLLATCYSSKMPPSWL